MSENKFCNVLAVITTTFSSFIFVSVYHHVNAQQPSRRPKERPPFAGFGFRPPAASGSGIRLKGLCPDGWEEGTSHDIYENEIPICIKINENLQTWADAKESCRQDFGFLLKVDSAVSVDGNDLMSLVLSKGMQSERGMRERDTFSGEIILPSCFSSL